MIKIFKTFISIWLISLLLIQSELFSQNELKKDIQDIKEKVIHLEEGQKNLDKRIDDLRAEMNGRFDDMNRRIDGLETSLNKRIDELREFLLWGFGVMFAGMFALIGFVIWDRRTALAPVAKHTRELAANQEKILAALREHAKHDEKLMEFMKHAGLW